MYIRWNQPRRRDGERRICRKYPLDSRLGMALSSIKRFLCKFSGRYREMLLDRRHRASDSSSKNISRMRLPLSLSLSLSSFIFDEQEISKPARRLSPCYTPKAYGEIAARVSPIDAGICNRDAQTFM